MIKKLIKKLGGRMKLRKRKCPRCGYEWTPRVADPKECPRCKGRLD
ncbi:unnamed protein product, partial [marine sediment metagenome]